MREPKNRGVFVAISGSPLVTLLEGTNLRIRRQLHHAERYGCTRKGMTVRTGPDERIDQGQSGLCRKGLLCDRGVGQTKEQSNQNNGCRFDREAGAARNLDPMYEGSHDSCFLWLHTTTRAGMKCVLWLLSVLYSPRRQRTSHLIWLTLTYAPEGGSGQPGSLDRAVLLR